MRAQSFRRYRRFDHFAVDDATELALSRDDLSQALDAIDDTQRAALEAAALSEH